jgi:hypothetical protein
MNQPQLSILIPSVPSRTSKMIALMDKLQILIGDKNIEILCLIDNKTKSIGEKRDNLVQASTGKYIVFLDDDDDITHLNSVYSATHFNFDVITFKSQRINADGSISTRTRNLKLSMDTKSNENELESDFQTRLLHNCAWHNKFKKFHFPFVNEGEDIGWEKQFQNLVQTEYFVNEVIYKYNANFEI